jgi:hypothetical protein
MTMFETHTLLYLNFIRGKTNREKFDRRANFLNLGRESGSMTPQRTATAVRGHHQGVIDQLFHFFKAPEIVMNNVIGGMSSVALGMGQSVKPHDPGMFGKVTQGLA